MKRRIVTLITLVLTAVLAGCGGGGSGPKRPWDTLAECEQENTELSLQVQQLEEQKDRLTEQVMTLSALDEDARRAALDTLDKIRIGKHSGFYDKDENGTNEMLVIYLKPLDTTQDTVKAAGEVTVELWDLNADGDKAKLAEWTVGPSDLLTSWGGTIFYSYYRLKFPLKMTPDPHKEYTLKVTFTDYISGNILTDQTVIHP